MCPKSTRITLTCQHCGKPYTKPPSQLKDSKYCSRPCAFAAKVRLVACVCPVCGKTFKRQPSKITVDSPCCSMQCRGRLNVGTAAYNYKGGRSVGKSGYVVISRPDTHTSCLEHRYVMEVHLGRRLRQDEHVHHINGVRDDNRLENLELLDARTHNSLHSTLSTWSKLYDCCQVCGQTDRPHKGHGMCTLCLQRSKRPAPGPRPWAKKFDCCVQCGRTKHEHVGHGLCRSCFLRHWRATH